jgi:hypothetical protein
MYEGYEELTMGIRKHMVVILCCLLVSCRTTTDGGNRESQVLSDSSPKKVVALCFATQGNGFNYAATLSWIAETLYISIERVRQMEAEGETLFDLNCIAGSSSGSLVSNIYGGLLTNPSFTKGKDPDRLLTVNEVERLADGLRWMSLSADLSVQSYLNLVGQVVSQWLEGNRRKVDDGLREIWGGFFQNERPSWWDGSYVDAEQILVDFLANTLIANRMTETTFKERDDLGRLIHFPYFPSFQDIPASQSRNIDKGLGDRAKSINQISESFLQSQFPVGEYLGRYQIGPYQKKNTPLFAIAEDPMPTGSCTLTMAGVFDSKSSIPLDRLSYTHLRPVMFCDEKTLLDLLSQKGFREQIAKPGSLAGRMILLAAKNRRVSLAMSLREPKMMRPFLGTLGDEKVEVSGIFDPQNPAHKNDLRLWPMEGQKIAITGGYLDRRINAGAISYYFASRVERRQKEGYLVMPTLHLFGKPDKDREKKFDAVVIREIFSNNPTESESNLKDWYSLQRDFCGDQASYLTNKYKINIHTTSYNWDIQKQPAAVSGSSRLIAYKSANAARLQTPDLTPRRIVFDPNPEVPEPINPGTVLCYE